MEFITIENRERWLIKEIPNYHPDDPRHTLLWREYKKKCIEGVWEKDFDGYRFMPGNLWFYINFCIILDADKKKKARYKIKPLLRDLEWERAYMCLEAYGFSGFSDDEYITCNHSVRDYLKTNDKDYLVSLTRDCYKGDGSLKDYLEPREYLRKLHSQPLGKPLYHNNAKNTMELGSRGGGKQLKINELIRIKNGWKEIQHLKVGELVYGSNGKLAPVTFKSDIEIYPYYKITLRDGREIEACENHLWKVWDKNKNRKTTNNFSIIKTKDLYESYYWDKIDSKHKSKFNEIKKTKEFRYAIPLNNVIQEDNISELKIDPYLLGILLGDSSLTQNISITSNDNEIINFCKDICEKNEWTFKINKDFNKNKIDFYFTNKNNKNNFIKNELKKLNLLKCKSDTKFIPENYLYSSEENRWKLLQGLMDTDGFADNRHIEYYTVSKQLCKDVENLIRSLGLNCKTTLKTTHYKDKNGNKITCKPCYRISIYGHGKIFRLERKQNFVDLNINKGLAGKSKWNKTFIVNIEPIGNKKGLCIGVDNEDNTYITKDYIVTHNSYWYSLGINLYEVLFDGAKEYTEDTRKNPATIEVLIGAAIASKSSEFCAKISLAMNELATNPMLGCWGKPGDEDYQPSPFYKDMAGSLEPNNAKNPYIHKYSKKVNGRWVDGFGTGSKILHTTFTQENPEAGAGTRPVKITVEEVGLVPNVLTVHQSNDAAQNKDDIKFGSSHYLGTAGNIDKIIETRIMFTEPRGYDILAYNDDWEHTGEIGFFLPAYYTNNTFKDEHGNTNIEKAKAFYEKRRADAKKVSSQKYDGELMNYPLVPSEMFLGREGKILPITELKEREKQLLLHNNYKKIGTAIDIYFDSSKYTGVDYKILENVEPIYEFPTKRDANIEGCIMMYEAPIEIDGKVPNDLYDLIGFDPYISENLEDGESLGSVYVMKNPKYSALGYGGNEIVCGYTGKHSVGRTRFLENVEKIIMMYGNPLQGLWFEGNRGDYVKGYFEKKYKLQHLCLRPQIEKGVRVMKRPIAEYGWITGNRTSKIQLIDMLAEWLKEETLVNGIIKRNYERLPDIALVRELIAFDLDKGNYDRCMALVGCIVGLREKVNQYEKQVINKNNPLSLLANNDNLFNRHNYKLKKRKALITQQNYY